RNWLVPQRRASNGIAPGWEPRRLRKAARSPCPARRSRMLRAMSGSGDAASSARSRGTTGASSSVSRGVGARVWRFWSAPAGSAKPRRPRLESARRSTGAAGSRWSSSGFFEGIADIEELELPEIGVVRVEGADAMLAKQRGQMSIRYAVPTSRHRSGDLPIQLPEALLLGQQAHVREAEQCIDVAPRFLGRERIAEDGVVGGDPQVRHDRGPGETEHLSAPCAVSQELSGAARIGTPRIRRVQEDIG